MEDVECASAPEGAADQQEDFLVCPDAIADIREEPLRSIRVLRSDSATRNRPILPLQTGNAIELSGIRRDDSRAAPPRLTGDEDIVRANRLACELQLGANSPRFSRVFIVEHRPFERAGEERFDPSRVGFFALTLAAAVPQLEADHGRQQEGGIFGDGPLKSSPDITGRAVD
jgi:hypothetical protein